MRVHSRVDLDSSALTVLIRHDRDTTAAESLAEDIIQHGILASGFCRWGSPLVTRGLEVLMYTCFVECDLHIPRDRFDKAWQGMMDRLVQLGLEVGG